jgi:integrase
VIPEKNWDKTKERVKLRSDNYKEINLKLSEIEEKFNDKSNLVTPNEDRSSSLDGCFLDFMKNYLENGLSDGSIKSSTYRKYITILNNLRKITIAIEGKDYLPFRNFNNINFIREITLGLKNNHNVNGNTKNPEVVINYLAVIKSVIIKWNKFYGFDHHVNTFTFFNFVQKSSLSKSAVYLNESQLYLLMKFEPDKNNKKTYYPQLVSKNIFIFQYHACGIRLIDILLLTNKSFIDNKFIIPVRKTSDIITAPICKPLMDCLIPFYPEIYDRVVGKIKLIDLKLDLKLMEYLMRLEDINFEEIHYHDLSKIIEKISKMGGYEDFTMKLKEILKVFTHQIMIQFFKEVKELPTRFLFPMLKMEDFKDSFDKNRYLNIREETILKSARSKHNNSLMRISEILNLPIMTGHTPRHTLVSHLLKNDQITEDQIRIILGHSNIATTKVYLREKHGDGQSHNIMKRFLETNVMN